MTEIDKVAWIEIHEKKILSTKSIGKNKYYIPGGKREMGESDEQTLAREVLEELNVEIVPGTVKYIGTFMAQAHGQPAGTIVKMTCYRANHNGEFEPKNEIKEFKWLNYSDRDKVSEVDKKIFDYLKENGELA